jgi:hypothetical protein
MTDIDVFDAGEVGDPPPRRLSERLRLAIRWCRDYHALEDDPNEELAPEFIRHLGHMDLKLVWTDGRDLTPEQIHDTQAKQAERIE